MMNRFETYFDAYYAHFTAELYQGQFENSVCVIMPINLGKYTPYRMHPQFFVSAWADLEWVRGPHPLENHKWLTVSLERLVRTPLAIALSNCFSMEICTASDLYKIHVTGTAQASRQECIIKNYFSYFSPKTYVVGTQKSRLNATVLLSTQIYVKIDG